MTRPTTLEFDGGTLVVRGAPRALQDALVGGVPECRWDSRAEALRAPACRYRPLLTALHRSGQPYEDRARAYAEKDLTPDSDRQPLDHQAEGLAAWQQAGRRGVVVLPTGSGKTWLGVLAIADAGRSALVVTPTLDLVAQWAEILAAAFPGAGVGVIGGGTYQPDEFLTVITYASAHRKMDYLGNRYGLLIFDEVHHLPGANTLFAARGALAPFRLGLTATVERQDGGHHQLNDVVGPEVYRRGIQELSGEILAPYRVETIDVELTDAERARYESERELYLSFLRENDIRIGGPGGWRRFIQVAAGSPEGRRAFEAHRNQRDVTRGASGKLDALGELLERHRKDRTIVFTADNRTVYEISRRFLVPALTHQTKMTERRALLAAFADGSLPVLVTSQVLNEGVDVPEASVGVILSGSGSVREHVQRLGRILRRQAGKQAVLYEVLTRDTSERYTSERRREHPAYQAASPSGYGPAQPPPGPPPGLDEPVPGWEGPS